MFESPIKIPPLVSILCITYNHEQYISQAIEGFLIQKTKFPIEIIIHDDASTDNTAIIIRSYEEKSPNLFYNIYQIENQFSKGDGDVGKIAFSAARGKYIALCEGDDYWTDPYKLQKQVDFLEGNDNYGMTYSNVRIFYQAQNKFSYKNWAGKATTFNELINGNTITTMTAVFRKSLYEKYELDINPQQKNWLMGDYPLWLYIALKSKIYFLDDVTGVYRILNESLSHSIDIKKRETFVKSSNSIKQFFLDFAKISYTKTTIEDNLNASLGTNALLMNNRKHAKNYFDKIVKLSTKNRIKLLISSSRILSFLYKKFN
ncbi:MAG TPA: hypothetical protein DCG75_14345 [Bacteroidales bacterium]|nr:hypothetical protein [Bacteroidales bacterium]